jgi:hypothetical protein
VATTLVGGRGSERSLGSDSESGLESRFGSGSGSGSGTNNKSESGGVVEVSWRLSRTDSS